MNYRPQIGAPLSRRAVVRTLLCGAALGGGFGGRSLAHETAPQIDFSYAGYGAGMTPPIARATVILHPSGADDTRAIQQALYGLWDESGKRAPVALLLGPGRFRVGGQLLMPFSGVVLRGSPGGATIIAATGTGRRTLIVAGARSPAKGAEPVAVRGPVAAGAMTLPLEDVSGLVVGARIAIRRPSTAKWIADLGMNTATGNFVEDRLHWKPGTRDLVWDRTVAAVSAARREITLDAPITYALDPVYGGGTVSRLAQLPPSRIGIENLTLVSEHLPVVPDEEHSWIAIALDNVEDAWVRNVNARHFVGSAVRVGHRARRVTVDRVKNLAPVSEIGGYRRQSFVVEGQQVLVSDCYAEEGLNDFSTGMLAAGPNVFLRCTAERALGASGGFESFSVGTLFDNVRISGARLNLGLDKDRVQAAGWTNANSVLWRSTADRITLEGPPGGANVQQTGDGSLYERQRRARLGPAPTPPTARAENPKLAAPPRVDGGPNIQNPMWIVGGRFAFFHGDKAVWGGALNHGWWRGQTYPDAALDHGRSFSRFVPGRIGRGLTEDIDVLAQDMVEARTPFFQSGPGLWYDRRRDDHALVERPNGDVWAPFYEMAWARSGTGKAFDGLSKYDLTRYNPWYFERLREFTQACDSRGLIHYHNLYNTHNVLETAAHWTDYPWRPFNNINDTGLPEPMPLEARDTVHLANQFYSTAYPPLEKLHRAYIEHVLNEIGGATNLVLGVGFQFVGPLAFQQYFLDVAADWQRRTGKTLCIALTTSKDITDAILADPVRCKQIAIVDTRYWQYRPDGTLWAPKGGRNLAFREMVGEGFGRATDFPPATTPAMAYRQVAEYRTLYPDKAIVAWNNGINGLPALVAGAAQVLNRNPSAGHGQGRTVDRTPVDAFVQEHLADVLPTMVPANDLVRAATDTWALADPERRTVLVYSAAGMSFELHGILESHYQGQWFDPKTGRLTPLTPINASVTTSKPDAGEWALLLRKR